MEIKKTRTFGELINDSFSFVSQNFIGIYKPVLLMAGPFALLSAFFYSKIELSFLTEESYGNLTINNILYIITFLIANLALYGVVYAYIYFYIKEGKGNFTIENVSIYLKRNFSRIFGALLFVIVFVTIGLFLFVLPGIYLLIPLLFMVAVVLFEGLDYQMAMFRCLIMIKGVWWKTFWLILLVNGIVIVFGLILKVPEFIYSILLKTSFAKSVDSLPIQFSIVATLTQFIIFFLQVFPIITVILQYFNLNEQLVLKNKPKEETILQN